MFLIESVEVKIFFWAQRARDTPNPYLFSHPPTASRKASQSQSQSRPQSQQLARASLVHLVSAVHRPARPLAQNRWLASEADFTRANQEPHERVVVYFVRTVVVMG